jgi:hypothetical protein
MLEIIVVWRLAVHIGNEATQKGLKKLGYQVMAILLWICGEVIGAALGNIIFGTQGSLWQRYVATLLGGIVGAGIAFLVMKLVPTQEGLQVSSPAKTFGRSGWAPTLVVVVAVLCLCVAVGANYVVQIRSVMQQVHATNPKIGTELNGDGQIAKSVTEVPSDAEVIYMSFYFDLPTDKVVAVGFDWSINGQLAYSFTENIRKGQVVTKLNRTQLGVSEFPKGEYEVRVHMATFYLVSVPFVVK